MTKRRNVICSQQNFQIQTVLLQINNSIPKKRSKSYRESTPMRIDMQVNHKKKQNSTTTDQLGEGETADGSLKQTDADHFQRVQTNGIPYPHMCLINRYIQPSCDQIHTRWANVYHGGRHKQLMFFSSAFTSHMSSAIQWHRHQLSAITAAHPPAWSLWAAVDNM